MARTLSQHHRGESEMFENLAYWPRIGTYDGRTIEKALAGSNLLDPGVSLDGAILDASYVMKEPELVERLVQGHVPYLVDPQSLRFISPAFLEVEAIRSLPYAPEQPVTPDMSLDSYVREALLFQQKARAAAFLVPALPCQEPNSDWARFHSNVHQAAAAVLGHVVDQKPLVGFIAPGAATEKNPHEILRPLLDLPLEAVYVQPLRLNPVRDSVEKLVRYCTFLRAVIDLGLPVFSGRVGAFGLLLQSLGVTAFDSGLGEAEVFTWTQLTRMPEKNRQPGSGGGRKRRIYIEKVKSTLLENDVSPIMAERGLRHRFGCHLGCCKHRGYEDLGDRRREHYLRTRIGEVKSVAQLPTGDMRIEEVHKQLLEAQGHAQVVTRVMRQRGKAAPSFDHIDSWLSLLSRVAGIRSRL